MPQFQLEKVDLCAIKAIAHDGSCLQVLIERDGAYSLEFLSAPAQAFDGLLQLARFSALTQADRNGTAAKAQLLDEIRMIPVVSSNIVAIGYSDVCKVLQVDFVNRTRYRYFDVPPQVFRAFLDAPSSGRFLNNIIKSEYGFDYQRVG